MKAPFVLLVLSGLCSAGLFFKPGHDDLLFLSLILTAGAALLVLYAALMTLLRSVFIGNTAESAVVVLDGSNIMHWRNGEADLATVSDVVRSLKKRGFSSGVVFDANAGYKLDGRYQHHPVLARKLGLPTDRVMVVNKGEIADGMILRVAQDFGARVVSNDRFRDWAAQYPKVQEPGFLISGGYRKGVLQLDL